ncbi:hypothetical protein JB92DRAFT_3207746, partial [Gautieria morchelliformis]
QQPQSLPQPAVSLLPPNVALSLPSSAPPSLQGTSFMPPVSLNPALGMSLDRTFSHIESALWLAIARHEFRPGHLYKLDTTMKEKPNPKTFAILDEGEFTQQERDASPRITRLFVLFMIPW